MPCAAVKKPNGCSSASANLMDVHLRDVTLDDIESLAHINITANESAFRGLVPDECLIFTEAESAANWRRFLGEEGLSAGDFMVIAEAADGEAMGYVWGGEHEDGSGVVRQLFVLPTHHRHGLGRRLVGHVAERLAERGIYRMTVEVAQVNPNRLFYECLGAMWLSEHPFEWDGVPMMMDVYQWEDTRLLLDRRASS